MNRWQGGSRASSDMAAFGSSGWPYWVRPVFPTVQSVRLRVRTGRTTAHSPSFWGLLGRTTPGKVKTGRTIGDYSPSARTSGTSQADTIHLQTDPFHIIRHHSFRPQQSYLAGSQKNIHQSILVSQDGSAPKMSCPSAASSWS